MRSRYPTPPRSCLARVEHGNPVGVRNTPGVSGALTVRKADHPSGHRMAQEANVDSRKAAGNRGTVVGSFADLLG